MFLKCFQVKKKKKEFKEVDFLATSGGWKLYTTKRHII